MQVRPLPDVGKYVRTMADDEILEEEVSYVMLDFGGILEGEFESKMDKPCKILGLDTDKPYVDIGGSVFKGEFEDASDTFVFFEADGTQTPAADGNAGFDNMRYLGHTSKKINLAHSLLSKKGKETETSDARMQPSSDVALHSAEDGRDSLDVPEDVPRPSTNQEPVFGSSLSTNPQPVAGGLSPTDIDESEYS